MTNYEVVGSILYLIFLITNIRVYIFVLTSPAMKNCQGSRASSVREKKDAISESESGIN